MAALNFPSNPNNGDTFVAPNGAYYTYHSISDKWSVTGGSYVPMIGTGEETMTGEILLYGNPQEELGAVPKQYVDTQIAGETYWNRDANLGVLSPENLGDSLAGITNIVATGSVTGIMGVSCGNLADTTAFSVRNLDGDPNVPTIAFRGNGSAVFEGQVVIPETPTTDKSAASKKYVDDMGAGRVTTVTGVAPIVVTAGQTPEVSINLVSSALKGAMSPAQNDKLAIAITSDDTDASSWGFVDTDITLSGNSNTKLPTQKAVKTYVDTQVAAEDYWKRFGTTLSPENADDKVQTSATLAGDSNATLTTKGYVDTEIADAITSENYWDRDGTTLSPENENDKVTSAATIAADDDATLTTKGYVDTEIADAITSENYWDRNGTTLNPETPGDDIGTSGRIGAGTTSPYNNLTVVGDTDATQASGAYTATVETGSARLNMGAVSGAPAIQSTGTGTSYNLLLNPYSGRVGIGTNSSPLGFLEIGATAQEGVPAINITTPSNWNNASDIAITGNAVIGANTSLNFVSGSGNLFTWNTGGASTTGKSGASEKMRLNNTGLGLNTTNPTAKLEVWLEATDTSTYFKGGGLRGLRINDTTSINPGDVTNFTKDSSSAEFTFGNNNGELVRIDKNGKVGIGTDTPNGTLEVSETNAGSQGGNIIITNRSGTAGTSTALYFQPNTETSRRASIRSVNVNGGNYANLAFWTSNSDTPAERMRITSAGFVGIGTNDPDQKLEVNGTVKATGCQINMSGTNWAPTSNFYAVGGNPPLGQLYSGGSYRVNLASNGYRNTSGTWTSYGVNNATGRSEIAVDPTGRIYFNVESDAPTGSSSAIPTIAIMNENGLGIKTTPQLPLDVKGPSILTFTTPYTIRATDDSEPGKGVGAGIAFQGRWDSTDANKYAVFGGIAGIKENDTDQNYAGALTFWSRKSGSGGVPMEKMRISNTGNVGINTTNPTAKLNVVGDGLFTGDLDANNFPTSDKRFKDNITPAKPQLADIVVLGGMLKNFDWNEGAPYDEMIRNRRQLGLIAQDIEEVCPSLIFTKKRTIQGALITPAVAEVVGPMGNVIKEGEEAVYEEIDDSYKTYSQDALIMKLLGAVAELKAEVDELKANR